MKLTEGRQGQCSNGCNLGFRNTENQKTINGVDSDIVQVQQSLLQSDPRPINSQAVKDEKYLSVKEQSWTNLELAQARKNINAIEGGDFLPRGAFVDKSSSNFFDR